MKIKLAKHCLLILCAFLTISNSTQAVHVWGGELEASCNGAGSYTLRLSLYVDCSRVTGMAATEPVQIYDKTGALVQTATLTNIIRDTLPTVANACAKTVAGTCIGWVVAEGVINLPMNADGYTLAYGSCCRNSNINNLVDPGAAGQIYTITLPGTNQVATCNSSPTFNALPPSEICTNMPTIIDFSASDADGDELVYKFFNPYGSTSGANNNPPPFPTVTFTAPYTFNNPMNSGLSIDPATGIITGTPLNTGLFALGVIVEEWRAGVLIGTKVRDFTYTVVPCSPVFSAGDPSVSTCANSPVQFGFTFDGKLKAGTTPLWDFGDPGSGPNNSSTLFDPTHQYPTLGTYYATVFVQDSCGNILQDTIKVDIVETVAHVDSVGDVCIGDNVTINSADTPCEFTEWYLSDTSTIPTFIGCSYDFILAEERKCIYFEPFVDPNDYTVGANAEQGWGTDVANATGFDAKTDLTIDGFTLTGDQYWNGCTNFNATITVEQAGFVVAGPVNVVVDCDGSSVFTDLKLNIPRGNGYSIKVTGATVRAGIGGPVNQIGLITVNAGGPFYNIKVHSNQKCARRDSICVVSDCPCPDTTLTFPPNFCANQTYNLHELLTGTTSPGTWSIKTNSAGANSGTIENDSIFNANGSDAGNYTFLYTITGNFPDCILENERTLEVFSVDSATITPNQGPFCMGDGNQTITLTASTTTGGTWSSSSATSINAASGSFDPADAGLGKHWVFYDSPSINCPAKDSIEIEVTGALVAVITNSDSSVCFNSAAFVINKSGNSSEGGTWTGNSITDSLFTPATVGVFTIKYAVNGLTAACSDSDSVTITVVPLDTAEITPNQGPWCENDTAHVILVSANTSIGGTWSSNTVGAIDPTTGSFSPATASVGDHWVYYQTPGVLCPTKDSILITITEGLKAEITTNDTSICQNSTPFAIKKSSDSNEGGIWIGNGIADSLFTPSTVGIYKIYYVVSGLTATCSGIDSITITVEPLDIAAITPDQGPYCTVDGNFVIQSDNNQTVGGTWMSNGPNGAINTITGEVDPLLMGIGKFWIYYNTPGILCPAVDSIEIEITSVFLADIITPDTSLCFNSSPFDIRISSNTTSGGNWSGDGLTTGSTFDPNSVAPGDYVIHYKVYGLTSACSDSDSVTVTVLAPDTAIITPNQGPYCRLGDKDTLDLNLPSTPGGTWFSNTASIVGTNGEFDPTLSGAGKHWIYYATNGTCAVTDSIELEVINELIASIKTNDTTVCDQSPTFRLKLNSNSTPGGTWIGTGITGSQFSPTTAGIGTFKIYYTVTGISAACSDIDSMEITVLPNANATITPPLPNNLCVGDNAITILNADLNLNGTWWSDPIGQITNTGQFTPTAANVGTTTIYYGIPGMCGDTSSTIVTVSAIQDPTVAQINPICEIVGDVNLSAINEGEWFVNGIPNNGVVSPSLLGPGLHEIVNLINDNCPISDTMYLEIKENPTPIIDADTAEGCYPLEVTFQDLTDSNALTSKWTISENGDDLFTTSQLDSLIYLFNSEGCFDISIESTFDYGCKNTSTLPYQICAHTPPNADFDFTKEPYSLLDPKVFTTNKSIDAETFLWKFGTGRDILNDDQNLIVEYGNQQQDTVDITLVASNGWCSDSITKSAIIWDYYNLFIPNAFTPNGDGLNEVFYPYGKNHTDKDYLFIIYDRWGDRIWETEVPYEGWDGTYKSNGVQCQIDTYVWKIMSRDQYNNELQVLVGIVSIVR